jgi:excisionase family DNA binding protein
MSRRAPVYQPLEPRPRDLAPEALAADGGMSVSGAAEWLSLSLRRVKELVADGTLPSVKAGRRRIVLRAGCRAYLVELQKARN